MMMTKKDNGIPLLSLSQVAYADDAQGNKKFTHIYDPLSLALLLMKKNFILLIKMIEKN